MQISVESLSTVKKKLTFQIPAEQVSTEYGKVFEQIRKKAAIKGFRKGKVPRALIEKHYADVLEQDVVKNLVNETYFKALVDEKIFPVSYPFIENDDLKNGEAFSYSAIVEVLPEIQVADYTGLNVTKELYQFDENVVSNRLKEMQEGMAQLIPLDEGQPVAAGNVVTLDFEGFVDGAPFEGGKATDFQLEIGSGRFIPGFEDQLIGTVQGEDKEINVTFPAEYGKDDLAGKDAVFKICVKGIKAKEIPQLDDEFAKGFGDFETLDQLKAQLGDMYEKQERDRIDNELRDGVVKALMEKNNIEIPESLIDQQAVQMLENAKKRLAYQRMTLEMMGLDEEQYKIQFRPVAESQVRGSLLLDALAKQENITVNDDDLVQKIQRLSGDSGQSFEAMKDYYFQNEKAKENLTIQVREDKVIDFLIGKAHITEVPREAKQG